MDITFRVLPFAEWHILKEQGIYPYAQFGTPESDDQWRILVAERDGKIVGCTSLHTQVHWDPWYVDSKEDGLSLVRGLIRQGRDELLGLNPDTPHPPIEHAFCTIEDHQAITQQLAERLGFKPGPGKLYLLNIRELDEV